MTNRAVAIPTGFRDLPPEPWGQQLRRARMTAPIGKISQEQAAQWIEAVTMRPIENSTISRLETRGEIPADPPRRRNAYLLCLLYEIDPAYMGLGPDDGPGELAERRLKKEARKVAREQANIMTRCMHWSSSDGAYGPAAANELVAA